jgi:hypothetical protein
MTDMNTPPPQEEFNLAVLTRQHVEATIREMGPERAWKALGVARTTLYRWMREWKRADRAAKETGNEK